MILVVALPLTVDARGDTDSASSPIVVPLHRLLLPIISLLAPSCTTMIETNGTVVVSALLAVVKVGQRGSVAITNFRLLTDGVVVTTTFKHSSLMAHTGEALVIRFASVCYLTGARRSSANLLLTQVCS